MPTQKSKDKGTNGARNGASIPFRYHGGSFENPSHFTHETKLAFKVGKNDFKNTSTFETGMIGGCLAALLGYTFNGQEKWME